MATFYNQATLSYNGQTVNSNITEGELAEAVTAYKTAVVPTYGAAGDTAFVISIVNSGEAAYTDLTVTDNLGEYTFGGSTLTPLTYTENSVKLLVNGELQAAPAVTSTEPLTLTGITVPAGGSAVIIYEAAVNEFAPPTAGSTIVNTAEVTGGGLTEAVTASAVISALAAPELSVIKSLTPTEVTSGSEVTYTFDIYNYGNTAVEAEGNAVITDTFTPALSGIAVSLDGAPLAAASYTYDEASGEFATAAGVITVPAAVSTQNAETGEWQTVPGRTTLTVTGTI